MTRIVSLILFLVILQSGLSSGTGCCFENAEDSDVAYSVFADFPNTNELPDSPFDCDCPQCINCLFCGQFTNTADSIHLKVPSLVISVALYDGYNRPIAPSPYIAGIKRPPIS